MIRRQAPATRETIARQLESLRRHVEALDISMRRLADRLVPVEDEERTLTPIRLREPAHRPTALASPEETLAGMLREIDAHVEAIERDFRSVRVKIEDIERRDLLSDEIKPYLKPEKPRRR